MESDLQLQNNRLLRAAVLLLINDTSQRRQQSGVKIELLLASAGLGYQEIAELLDKKPDAVRMLLKRNKQ